DLSIKPENIEFESEFTKTEKEITFKGKLDNREAWALVEGEISADLELACSRCLGWVTKHFDIDFETAFITAENFTEEQEIELEVKGLEVSIFEGNKIDLVEVAQEQILLSIPPQILCKEDCKGLCMKCGSNKNLDGCKCDEAEVDSRWSALGNLKIKDEK
ncbi:MAG: DUF177 domain-containing protein, partial [Acidobacteria bacterium]|nr:DUF177 domain-containing protein [Acidobacteriota bacterium]